MTGCKEYETQVDSYADPPPPSLAIPSTGSRHTAERRLPPPGDHQGLPPPDPAASQHERRCRLRLRSRRCCHRRWRGGREGGGGRPGPVRGAAARPGGRVAAGERRGSGLPRRRGCRVGAPGPPGHRCLLRARQPRPNAQGMFDVLPHTISSILLVSSVCLSRYPGGHMVLA